MHGVTMKLIFLVWQKSCNSFRAPRVSAECSLRCTEPVANCTLLINDFGRHTSSVSSALYSLYNGTFLSWTINQQIEKYRGIFCSDVARINIVTWSVTLMVRRNEHATSSKQRSTGFNIDDPKNETALIFAEFQQCFNYHVFKCYTDI